ncbi:hypothetical protein OAC15_05235, partial [Alphaproteobacteria bacterium]|nr:hypothetical protein [Alphaproteobacteria bacterium]
MNKILLLLILVLAKSAIANKNTEEVYVNSKNIFHNTDTNIIYLGNDSLLDYQGATIKTDGGKIDIKNKKINIDG